MALVYLVDTNTISEIEKMQPNPNVVARLEAHWVKIALASVSWRELLYGYHRLPESRRKQRLGFFIRHMVRPGIPVLPYDMAAAEWFAQKRRDLAPILRHWFRHEVRKMRAAINHTLQALGERPLSQPKS
jgi:tRNA(fMet)-specific endonuclease VapC